VRVSLTLLILAAIGFGVGVGWWIHPGAGIAIGSLALGWIALFRDDGKTQRGRR
jgi:hypothetical protein